jgi:superfamily I DNA/RNA helicase
MAKEKWLIDPGELDDFQREIRELSLSDSYVIKGCAGSGKTILALYRANDIRIEALAEDEKASASFTMVVYTKALRSFIKSGIKELGLDLKQVVYYDQWDGSAVDYIVVDEAQDFNKEELDVFMGSMKKSIMLYGDTQQQIYKGLKTDLLTIEEAATYLKLKQKELLKNYRLPKTIASFAGHLSTDMSLETKCIKAGIEKPKIKKFLTWQGELDYIISEINIRGYTDVAILLPFNEKTAARFNNFHRNIETVMEYLDTKGFRYEFKMHKNESDEMELDFDSDLPKIMTFHSCKGLQFEAVFIPFCDAPRHDAWYISGYKNPLYVALTRTYKHLYLTHSERLTPFFQTIPVTKYD